MNGLLKWFTNIWVGLVAALNLFGVVGVILGAEGFFDAWGRVADIYSPFNVWTHGLNILLVMPAFGAWWWREKRLKGSRRGDATAG